MSSSPPRSYHILVASYTDSIVTLKFTEPTDPTSRGSLTQIASTKIPGKNPSWLTAHPNRTRTQGSYVYACLEQTDGTIAVLKYGDDGTGEVVEQSEVVEGSRMDSPCHMTVNGEGSELFVANYMSGSVSRFTISLPKPPTSPILTRHPDITLPRDSIGCNKARQESPHAHQVFHIPSSNELWVSDLGSDKAWRYDTTTWELKHPALLYPPGSGPRNLALHPKTGSVFTVLELSSELAVHPMSVGDGKEVDVSTTRSTDAKGMLAAAILVPKSCLDTDKATVYVSNRNDPSPQGDTIAVFSFEESTGKAEKLGEYRTGLRHLRGMVFLGEDERFVVAGGQNNSCVKVLERVDGKDGFFREVASLGVSDPTGFLVL